MVQVEVLPNNHHHHPVVPEPEHNHRRTSSVSSKKQQNDDDVRRLSAMIPQLTQEWIRTVQKQQHHQKKNNKNRNQASSYNSLFHTNDLPKHPTDRAHWVAAMLYPATTGTGTATLSTDIRPALLSCTNDYDRLVLTIQALQTSLQQYRRGSSLD
jgi:hypothetical protein